MPVMSQLSASQPTPYSVPHSWTSCRSSLAIRQIFFALVRSYRQIPANSCARATIHCIYVVLTCINFANRLFKLLVLLMLHRIRMLVSLLLHKGAVGSSLAWGA